LRTVSDPIEEAKAVVELGLVWARMGQASAKGNPMRALLSNHPMMLGQKATTFWSSAFMPTTLEGLLAAGEQALGFIRPDAQLMDAQAMQMNKVIGPRLETIVELCELKGAGDPRVESFKIIARRKLEELDKGESRAWRNYILIFVGFFLFMGAALYLVQP